MFGELKETLNVCLVMWQDQLSPIDPTESYHSQPWYFGKISPLEAEKVLLSPGNTDGAFLVRHSVTEENCFTISLRYSSQVVHLRVENILQRYYLRNTSFATLEELIRYYSENGRLVDGYHIRLKQPCTAKPSNNLHGWEINRDFLKIEKLINGDEIVLGRGSFGEVKKGLWNCEQNRWLSVAIKSLNSRNVDHNEFVNEAKIMVEMKHKHLVRLYGVCMKEKPFWIVTELMDESLLAYLRRMKQVINNGTPATMRFVDFAYQIASGMAYLEYCKFVHRDLAARNILMNDKGIVKIADFGLSRCLTDDLYVSNSEIFPIRWTAPEAAKYRIFNTISDVWSFGIVLYEIWTFGDKPYKHIAQNYVVLDKVASGYRMDCPVGCDSNVYEIMRQCWHEAPHKRPTFNTLRKLFDDIANKDTKLKLNIH